MARPCISLPRPLTWRRVSKFRTWLGLVAPAGLPSLITQALALKLDAFTKDPDIRKQLDALGLLVDGSGPAAFSAFIDEESARMDKLIKKAGIRFE